MAIAFTISLNQNQWDENLGGWHCPALRIPSAKVDAVYVKGQRLDIGKTESLREHSIIRWIGDSDPPQDVVLSMTIAQELSTEKLTLKWKKLAITLPILTAIIVAVLGPVATYYFTRLEGKNTEVIITGSGNIKPYNVGFNISIQRGRTIRIGWSKMAAGDDERTLSIWGVDVDRVDDAVLTVYAALARRSSKSIVPDPFFIYEKGKPKLLPGYNKVVRSINVEENDPFSEFYLFQHNDYFVIGRMETNGEPIPVGKTDIRWADVRLGLSDALNALYVGSRIVQVKEPKLTIEPNNKWYYRLPYSVREMK